MTDSTDKKLLTRPDWLAALVITALIFVLHVYFWQKAGGFWRDEVNVINLAASGSPAVMVHDSFPIMLPMLIYSWTALGWADSDFQLRSLGMLIGLGMPVGLLLVALAARRPAPLLSLTLLGLNATAIFWGDSLRAYGLGAVFILFTLAAMAYFLRKPTWQRAGILAIAGVFSVQVLYHNAVLFASIGIGGWLVCWRRKDGRTALKILLAGLMGIISLLMYWNPIFHWQGSAAAIQPGFSFGAAVLNFADLTSFPLPQYAWVWKWLGIVVIVWGLAGLFLKTSRSERSSTGLISVEWRIFAGGTLLVSIIGYFCFLWLAKVITQPWYFLPVLAVGGVCLDLSISLEALPRWSRTAVAGVLIATIGMAMAFSLRDLNCRLTNADLVAKRLMAEVAPADYVVVTPWYMGISFGRYYHGPAAWDTLPPVSDHSIHRFDLLPSEAETRAASQPVYNRILATLKSGHKVWVAGLMDVPPPGRPAYTENGRVISQHCQSFTALPVDAGRRVCDFEEFSLLVASGWKTNTP